MDEKKSAVSLQDGELVVSRRSASRPGTNGNGAGTRQLPPDVAEPDADISAVCPGLLVGERQVVMATETESTIVGPERIGE